MNVQLKVLPVPVTDVERAKRFYGEQVGFLVDRDTQPGTGNRTVRLTPPGAWWSIVIGPAPAMGPGPVKGLQLVVADIEAARRDLARRGVEVSAVQHYEKDGTLAEGKGGRWNAFAFFDDPDGNGWVLQERPGTEP
ncbi:VOC family protein [Nonomuraea jiangxiensis]|uniref:Catechol 2,3-dioxygenase n=1 Tax=Nonomuraea jiangxiensis TaxID=633440 RepID=A0A1G9BHU9_9ACTN|nr:VOC family protein [Nonomuraea jiangxiensis]SDK39081.1 Catechol 2,3-dioxygenase [Nonomuraea jiangxiensis]